LGTFQIGHLKKGLNPPSAASLQFSPPYMMLALKTGIITGIIALAVSLPSMLHQSA
jgi:sulfate transporter 3